MKGNKLFTLDVNIIEQLKKVGNQSGLINNILKDYFNDHGAFEKEDLINKLDSKNKELRKLKEEIELIKDRIIEKETYEKRIRDAFKEIPIEIITDFKSFNSMTEEVLKSRYKDMYSKQYKIKWEEVLKAFKEFHGKRKSRE